LLILASGSPRRSELLSAAGYAFSVIPADIDEVIPDGVSPDTAVKSIALQKARNIAVSHVNDIIIGADTAVHYKGLILGKPANGREAHSMLNLLSGKTHEVYTGVAVIAKNAEIVFSEMTRVEFYPITDREIAAYIKTGEPFDKAGAYGIQGKGMCLVKRVNGDFYNVMGLPAARLVRVLKCLK